MYIPAKTLDDAMHRVFKKLLETNNHIEPTRGASTEFTGVLIKINNPRARLSQTERKGTLFSCIGELFWYLSRDNALDFISHYLSHYNEESNDGKTVSGGYGPRLFNKNGQNQVDNVTKLLTKKPFSRRAVIQLLDSNDVESEDKEIPCTCTLQFFIRENKLHMHTNMRSNDAYKGLPHDVFAFTMLQEIIARSLGVELGTYNHSVGSLHLYDTDRKGAQQFVDEGFQSTVFMPPMPKGDPWDSIEKVLEAERKIRSDVEINIDDVKVDDFWKDMIIILQIYQYAKNNQNSKITKIKQKLSTQIYEPYIEKKQMRIAKAKTK